MRWRANLRGVAAPDGGRPHRVAPTNARSLLLPEQTVLLPPVRRLLVQRPDRAADAMVGEVLQAEGRGTGGVGGDDRLGEVRIASAEVGARLEGDDLVAPHVDAVEQEDFVVKNLTALGGDEDVDAADLEP